MAGTIQLGGPGLFDKPRYRQQVLVGNWFEDRALRDYNDTIENRPVKPEESDIEQKQERQRTGNVSESSSATQTRTSAGFCFPPKYDSGVQAPDFPAVSSGDLLRGYYSTTYKRSYGPRPSYIHYSTASYLSARNNRQETALSPDTTMIVPSESDREIISLD